MKPAGRASVMAQHAPAQVEGDDARTALHRQLEFFPTPPWAARAGGELIGKLDPLPIRRMWAWEPACGAGHMAHGLGDYFEQVHATDIHDHGWDGQHGGPLDFTSAGGDSYDGADWIATNPPFGSAAEFVRLGLKRARRGVAILARLSFFESAGRFGLFYGERPLTAIAPFFERVPMQLGKWEPGGSTATAYAWFVWMHEHVLPPVLRPLRGTPVAMAIGPGTRERLTRPDDARRFGARGAAPLLDGLSEASS